MNTIEELQTLHTILWHARDDVRGKQAKLQLTKAIDIVSSLIIKERGNTPIENQIHQWPTTTVSIAHPTKAKMIGD